jgi:predicted RecB family nuclease
MRRGQVVRLNDVGISTVADLATASAATTVRIGNATFNRLREQAALQTQHRVTGLHSYTLLPPEPQRGFSLLPRPSAGDVFFDMEGDPYWEAGRGLEYLFGCVTNDNGQPRFHAFWAHGGAARKVDQYAARKVIQSEGGSFYVLLI